MVPYPYAEPRYPPAVPHDLARSLLAQRELFRGYRARFVPVDFTLPEDGFDPVDYGLEQLWSVIEELVPLGLRGMLGQTPEVRQAIRDELFRKAQPHIVAYAMAAGGAGAVPLPVVDVPLVLAAQARMLQKIAEIYQQPMDLTRMAEIAGALGIGFLTRLGVRELLKLVPVPGLGESVSALYAAASTYALGLALCKYFSRVRGGAKLDVDVIRRLYAAELKRSKLWIAERMRQPRARQGARPMIRGIAKIRAAIALVSLSIPYLLLFAAGSIWLFQKQIVAWWAGISLACTAAGWYLLRGLWQKVERPQVQPDLSWPPQGMEVWKQVEQLAMEVEGEGSPLDQPEQLVAVVRRVADVVARHYHPHAADPWLETPFPHVLRIVELVARDLRQATLGYVPGSHILTIGDLRRLQKLAGMARRSYFWYRIASFVINTPAAFLREARDAVFGQLSGMSTETAKRWAVGYFVRRTGYYAIQLYSGQMVLDDIQPDDAPLKRSAQDADIDSQRTGVLDKEPLRILVVGQKKSGKSSFVNALFGDYRAATDVVPRTDQVEPYVLEREGLQQAIILDTAGYDMAAPGKMLRPVVDHLHGCDMVVCVCSAVSAAREADRCFLSELRAEFQRNPDRQVPVVIAVLTHIDRLRPLQEWNPPYQLDPPLGPKAEQIADAVEAVAADLTVPPAEVIPVCLLPERIYNVEEALVPAMLEQLPAARRVKYLRCLRQQCAEQYWRRVWQQTLGAGRRAAGVAATKVAGNLGMRRQATAFHKGPVPHRHSFRALWKAVASHRTPKLQFPVGVILIALGHAAFLHVAAMNEHADPLRQRLAALQDELRAALRIGPPRTKGAVVAGKPLRFRLLGIGEHAQALGQAVNRRRVVDPPGRLQVCRLAVDLPGGIGDGARLFFGDLFLFSFSRLFQADLFHGELRMDADVGPGVMDRIAEELHVAVGGRDLVPAVEEVFAVAQRHDPHGAGVIHHRRLALVGGPDQLLFDPCALDGRFRLVELHVEDLVAVGRLGILLVDPRVERLIEHRPRPVVQLHVVAEPEGTMVRVGLGLLDRQQLARRAAERIPMDLVLILAVLIDGRFLAVDEDGQFAAGVVGLELHGPRGGGRGGEESEVQ